MITISLQDDEFELLYAGFIPLMQHTPDPVIVEKLLHMRQRFSADYSEQISASRAAATMKRKEEEQKTAALVYS